MRALLLGSILDIYIYTDTHARTYSPFWSFDHGSGLASSPEIFVNTSLATVHSDTPRASRNLSQIIKDFLADCRAPPKSYTFNPNIMQTIEAQKVKVFTANQKTNKVSHYGFGVRNLKKKLQALGVQIQVSLELAMRTFEVTLLL